VTTAQDGSKVVSLTHRPPLPPRKYPWYSFLLEAESTPGPLCDRKDYVSMIPAGIEPVTFRFVAQHLNHCATAVPIQIYVPFENSRRHNGGVKPFPNRGPPDIRSHRPKLGCPGNLAPGFRAALAQGPCRTASGADGFVRLIRLCLQVRNVERTRGHCETDTFIVQPHVPCRWRHRLL
jgi:hypothetical protein